MCEDRKATPLLSKDLFISRWKELGRILQQNTRLKQLPFHVTQYRIKDVFQFYVYYYIFISIDRKKKPIAPRYFVFFSIWRFCICVVGKLNERLTHQRKRDNELHSLKRGNFNLLFNYQTENVNLSPLLISTARNKGWNCSQIWLNTIVHHSEYAKEKEHKGSSAREQACKTRLHFFLKEH